MEALFMLPTATRQAPDVDVWLSAQRGELRPLVERWFSHMRRCGPDVLDLMHDGCPTACVGEAAFAYVGAYKAHVNVGFFYGATLPDPAHLLEGTGKRGRHVKLHPGRPVDEAALAALIEMAYQDIHERMERAAQR